MTSTSAGEAVPVRGNRSAAGGDTLLDLVGPLQVLSGASEMAPVGEVVVVGASTSDGGFLAGIVACVVGLKVLH